MQAALVSRLAHLGERFEELKLLLGRFEVIQNQELFRQYAKEYAELEPIVEHYQQWVALGTELAGLEDLQKDMDAALKPLVQDEVLVLKDRISQLEQGLKILLLPRDPFDQRNIFLEIRAGTGGDEAALFVGDLSRMYARFAERKGWAVNFVQTSPGEHGGYKELVMRIQGVDVYSQLKFESGAHRVQRVPATESQGRIHTSACTIAVLPEVAQIDAVEIDSSELRIDTYRASGAGGQHVNRTDSAVRITHLPTGTVVECQEERSQHKNKAKAMSLLQMRILSAQQEAQRLVQAETRRSLVGSGDRSERIRTYNYPQGRTTDHRINLTLYKLTEILEGELEPLIEPLLQAAQAEALTALSEAPP